MGRPTELVPAIHEEITGLLRAGMTFDASARKAGFAPEQVRKWVRWGKANEDREPYAAFAIAVEVARADASFAAILSVRSAFKKDWRSGAWFLEVTDRENYGKQSAVKIEVQRGIQGLLDGLDGVDREGKRLMSPEAYGEFIHAVAYLQGLDTGEAEEEHTAEPERIASSSSVDSEDVP